MGAMSGHAMPNMLKYAKVHRDLKPLNLLLTKYLEVHRHARPAIHTMQDVQEIAGASNSSYLFMLYVPCGHIGHSRYSMLFHIFEISSVWNGPLDGTMFALCLHYVHDCVWQSAFVRLRSKLQTWALLESWLGQGPSQVTAGRKGWQVASAPGATWLRKWCDTRSTLRRHLTPMNILAWKLLSFSDVSIVSPSVSWNILHHKFLWIRWDVFAKSRWGRCCLTVLDVKSCPFMPTRYDMLWLADTHRS